MLRLRCEDPSWWALVKGTVRAVFIVPFLLLVFMSSVHDHIAGSGQGSLAERSLAERSLAERSLAAERSL